jgi:hypothetical protein
MELMYQNIQKLYFYLDDESWNLLGGRKVQGDTLTN